MLFFYLTFPVLYISESCIEIKIKLDFYFHFFVVPQKVLWRPLRGYQKRLGTQNGLIEMRYYLQKNRDADGW